MTGLRAARVALTFVCCLAAAIANAQPLPAAGAVARPSDSATQSTPSGAIRGRIFGANGRPIIRAQVQLAQAESGRSLGFASTDEEGRYEFTRLAAGEYRLTAGKTGYLVMEYGQRRAFERGTPLTIADAAVLEKIDLTLPQSGVIAGRLLDENGDPVEGAMVQLFQARFTDGRRQLVPVNGVAVRTSNDLGQYRLFGIPPGEYIVCAATNLTVSRNVTDGVPGFAPMYAPGTPNAAEARTITVDLSQEVGDVDINFAPIATATISGHVTNAAGAPLQPNGMFVLSASHRSGALATAPMRGSVNGEGEFQIKNVPPGEYVLQVSGHRAAQNAEAEFAAEYITVAGRDVTGLHLRTSAGSTISGRITFEGSGERPRPGEVSVTTAPIDFDHAPLGGPFGRSQATGDWTFELRGVSGPRFIRLVREPPGWMLKAIRVNGNDVTDSPLTFGSRAEALDDVEIVLTRQVSTLSGRLIDSRGQPSGGYVVTFSSDRSRWGVSSRFVRLARAAADGVFSMRGLPPGDYYVLAVDRLLEGLGEWQDPDLLESLAPGALRTVVPEGQQVVVNPRIVSR
jgi:protocatechuate 3,4-dioxygenase beta subunit